MANTTSSVRPGEELDLPKLNGYLQARTSLDAVREVRQFPGGYSNLTYLLRTASGTSVPGTELVLRRPPFSAAAKGGHDMGREYRVLTALRSAGYPKAPEPLFFCDDETVLGAPFYGMERVAGVILRASDAPNPALTPARMRVLSEKLIDALSQLHALDMTHPELAALGRPDGYVRRQVAGWIGRYATAQTAVAQTDEVPAMTEVSGWLTEHLPAEQVPAFLHNDFKFDNVVWTEDLTEIRAVLDWEMATVGDPLMDLGAALAYWVEPGDSGFLEQFNLTHLPGTLSRREAAERYATATGRDLSEILFYYAFGLYKNAVILQQIYARWKAGHTRDPRFGGLLAGVRALSAQAVRAIQAGEISS